MIFVFRATGKVYFEIQGKKDSNTEKKEDFYSNQIPKSKGLFKHSLACRVQMQDYNRMTMIFPNSLDMIQDILPFLAIKRSRKLVSSLESERSHFRLSPARKRSMTLFF